MDFWWGIAVSGVVIDEVAEVAEVGVAVVEVVRR